MIMPSLFKHQEEAVNFILSKGGSGAIWHEMGLGKTRTAYEIFSWLHKNNPRLRMFIVSPLSLLESAWHEDCIKFGYPYSFGNLHDDFDLHGGHTIVAINYESLLSKGGKIIQFLKAEEWLCVLDESSKIKNYQSQITKFILKIAPLFKHRIAMSGTPAPNNEIEYWPQMQFVRPGSLGTSFTAFRAYFFHLANRYSNKIIAGNFISRQQAYEAFKRGAEYRITDEKRKELMRLIHHISHSAKKKDCLDLPEQIDEIRIVEMSTEQRKNYHSMEKELVLQIKNEVIAAPLALTKLMKLRQLSSGFCYNSNGEAFEVSQRGQTTNELTECAPAALGQEFTNPKLKELFDVIEEVGDQQMIIWINFHWEQIKICHELFKKFGENSVVTLSALTKNKDGSIKAFQDGRARFLVAHPASAAHGLTFVNCSLQVFFSLDYSAERYEQARARIHRAGQTKSCLYVHIICKKSIDEVILKVLKQKCDSQKIVYEFLRENDSVKEPTGV